MLVTYDPPPQMVLGVSEQGLVMVLGVGTTVTVAVVIAVVVAIVVAVIVDVKVPQNEVLGEELGIEELDGVTIVVLEGGGAVELNDVDLEKLVVDNVLLEDHDGCGVDEKVEEVPWEDG